MQRTRRTMNQARARQSGFTVVELLTAVFITMIMMLLIARIFSDTTAAVGDGIGLSEVMANARSIGDQLKQDLRLGTLVGPTTDPDKTGGFLVIGNQQVNARYLLPGGGEGTRLVRTDQFAFFVLGNEAAPLRPATPGHTNSYFNGVTADAARVWMGHVRVLRANFDSGSFTDIGVAAQDKMGSGSNAVCTHWTLGRQKLLLSGQEKVDSANLSVYVNGAIAGSSVSGAGGTLRDAFSDVSNWTLQEVIKHETRYGQPGHMSLANGVARPEATYGEEALKHSFVQGTFQRPFARAEMGKATAGRHEFSAGDVAQLHTYMAANCSDFIVEFAGDYDGVSGLDKTTNPVRIRWYGAFVDADAGTTTANFSGIPATDLIRPQVLTKNSEEGTNVTYYVFRHDDTKHWPWLLRIRYRLHDKAGRLMDVGNQSGKWFEATFRLREDILAE